MRRQGQRAKRQSNEQVSTVHCEAPQSQRSNPDQAQRSGLPRRPYGRVSQYCLFHTSCPRRRASINARAQPAISADSPVRDYLCENSISKRPAPRPRCTPQKNTRNIPPKIPRRAAYIPRHSLRPSGPSISAEKTPIPFTSGGSGPAISIPPGHRLPPSPEAVEPPMLLT